jgi:hypothetical protein
MKNVRTVIQSFLDTDASAVQICMSKFELEQQGIDTTQIPETTGVLITLQYVDLDADVEDVKDPFGLKLPENKN